MILNTKIQKAYIHFIICFIAAEPACKETEFLTEEGYHHNITFQCSVKYRGNLDPFIEWKESGISLQENTSNNLVKKGLSKMLISSLEVQIPIHGRSSDLKIERFLSISGNFIGNNSEYNFSMERRIKIPLETETKNNIDGMYYFVMHRPSMWCL